MTLKNYRYPLILVLSALLAFYGDSMAVAQEGGSSSSFMIGVNIVYDNNNIPQDPDYEDANGQGNIDKYDFYFDITSFRLGFNAVHGKPKNGNDQIRLQSNAYYLAYRASTMADGSSWDLYLMGGIAYVLGEIHLDEEIQHTSNDMGWLLGTGVLYLFQDTFWVGLQLLDISAQAEFGGEKSASGSRQFQLVFRYPL